MGELLREYWHPLCLSDFLTAGGAPRRLELLSEKIVAFRMPDGNVGVLDEACAHRRVTLALARNEEGGLRCIYHGWKFAPNGRVLETPSEPPEYAKEFASRISIKAYPTREAGGVVWIYMGSNPSPPEFPYYEFLELPANQVDIRLGVVNTNWVQGIEGTLDSAHLPYLHRSQDNGQIANDFRLQKASSPQFEVVDTPYGFKEGAIRRMDDGKLYVKIREFVAPYYSYVPGFPENLKNRMVVASVPFNDVVHAQWHFYYNVERPFEKEHLEKRWLHSGRDRNDFYADHGNLSNLWGQDREAMEKGHFSGFVDRYISVEDFIVQEAMGAILDRTKEVLGRSDQVIVFARKRLINAAKNFRENGTVWGRSDASMEVFSKIRSCAVVIGENEDWKAVDPHALKEINHQPS